MIHPGLVSRVAAAITAAVLVILAAACGDDDGAASPTPATSSPSTSVSPSGDASIGKTIDLGSDAAFVTYAGQDPTDLVTAASSLALGDFNDDGKPDLLVGAPQADGPQDKRVDGGEAYVIFGPLDESRDLGAGLADVTVFGAAAGDSLGYTVLAGDLNDDGIDDVLVGAPGVTAGFDPRSDQGRIYVFFGGKKLGDNPERDLAEDVFDFTLTGSEGFSRLGHAMDLGDINGDGSLDLVAGAPFAGRKPGTAPGGERTALGEVYVVFGSGDLSGEKNVARDEFDVLLTGLVAYGQFGASVGAGDVNGDHVDDVVIGAYRASETGQTSTNGFAYVFFGRNDFQKKLTGEETKADTTIKGSPGTSFGFPLAIGDYNGDKIDDMAFGAQLESSGSLDRQGSVHVIYGANGLDAAIDMAKGGAALTISGRMTAELSPSALASADIDDDGADDLLVGSGLANAADDRPGSGIAYVFTEIASLPARIDLSEQDAPVSVFGAAPDDRLGVALTGGQLSNKRGGLVALASQASAGNGGNDEGVIYVVPLEE